MWFARSKEDGFPLQFHHIQEVHTENTDVIRELAIQLDYNVTYVFFRSVTVGLVNATQSLATLFLRAPPHIRDERPNF